MYFQHAETIWSEFPELVPGVLLARGIDAKGTTTQRMARFQAMARERLAGSSEGEMPEIRAWRRTFSKMGLKPTQYRCASEALLRRFRQEGSLPALHPLVDLCNAMSLAFAIPIAVFDVARVEGGLEVRRAAGDETYLTFAGETEHPEPGEVIFADAGNRAHARRWTNRQSGLSAVRDQTIDVLIVSEAMHETAHADMTRLICAIEEELAAVWSVRAQCALLSRFSPRFDS